jgi:hypothetical protein
MERMKNKKRIKRRSRKRRRKRPEGQEEKLKGRNNSTRHD